MEATPEAIEKALAFVRASRLRGGTNVQAALDAGLAQAFTNDPYIVVLGDLGATRGILQNGKLAEWYAGKWRSMAESSRPRTYVFAVGDDANLPLGRMLARNHGVFEAVRSIGASRFQVECVSYPRSGGGRWRILQLTTAPAGNFDLVYRLEESRFFQDRCRLGWVNIRSRRAGYVHGERDTVRRSHCRRRIPSMSICREHVGAGSGGCAA